MFFILIRLLVFIGEVGVLLKFFFKSIVLCDLKIERNVLDIMSNFWNFVGNKEYFDEILYYGFSICRGMCLLF